MTQKTAPSPIKMNWEALKKSLPNTAQFLKLSIQKLRLEYRDKEEMQAIWRELGSRIGRRGALCIEDTFEVGCGFNSTLHIDAVKHPPEAAQLKELYAAIQSCMKEAEVKGWTETTVVPNLTLSVTGVPAPVEPTQDEVKAMVALVHDNKQREEITAENFKLSLPACFRFSHRRRQEKAIDKKLDFIRDQAMAELADYRKGVLGKQGNDSISLRTEIEGQVVATVSFFDQPQTSLSLPDTAEGNTFKEKLGDARKAPNKHLQRSLAQGKATPSFVGYATLKAIPTKKVSTAQPVRLQS